MAKLLVPVKAYAWKGDKIVAGGKLMIVSHPGKFHMEKSSRAGAWEHSIITVCNKIIDVESERTVIANIADLTYDDLCHICLGAMTVEEK